MKKTRQTRRIIPILLTLILLMLSACTSIDCPLNNTVYSKFQLAGDVTSLPDTLNVSIIRADGTDSLVLNSVTNATSFLLPMSYARETDIFYLDLSDEEGNTTSDVIEITKENHPHFESVDCAPAVFHTITSVNTTHHAIETIEINHPEVNYDANKAHFLIYFKNDRY